MPALNHFENGEDHLEREMKSWTSQSTASFDVASDRE
jgi:hypothetical protein